MYTYGLKERLFIQDILGIRLAHGKAKKGFGIK
jgi:hypothetical protein